MRNFWPLVIYLVNSLALLCFTREAAACSSFYNWQVYAKRGRGGMKDSRESWSIRVEVIQIHNQNLMKSRTISHLVPLRGERYETADSAIPTE